MGPAKANVCTVAVQYDDGTSQVLATRCVTSTTDIEKTLLSRDPWSIDLYATSGGPRYKGCVTDANVQGLKGRGNTMDDDQWAIMVYQLLFSELKKSQRKNFFLEANTTGGNDLIDEETTLKALDIVRNPLMKQTIGSIPMAVVEDGIDEQFELFDWMKQLNDDKLALQESMEEESIARADAEKKNETAAKEAEAFEKKMHEEKTTQMKIYTVMINNMKEAYRRALRGEISEEEDLFNMNVVRASLEAVKLDNLKKEPKRRKIVSPKKKKKAKKKPIEKENDEVSEIDSDAEAKLADEILEEGDEDEEVIPDSQESPTKPKNESITPTYKASKAKSLTSLRFGDIGKKDDDEEIPTDVETDDDVGEEVIRAGFEYDEDAGDSDRTLDSDGETDADTDD